MTANRTFRVTSDANYVVDAVTVLDRLESKVISWAVRPLGLIGGCEFAQGCSIVMGRQVHMQDLF